VIVRPVSPYAESDGRVTRLYAAPRWVQVGGVFIPIEQAIAVQHDPATEGYRVQFGKEFIELRPNDPTALKAAVTSRRTGLAFGPVLDAAKAPATIGFTVARSDGVVAMPSGWQFKGAGAPVGLFVHEWMSRFRSKCVLAADAVTLDLAEAKQKALAKGRPISLDPTISSGLFAELFSSDSYWEDARDGIWYVDVEYQNAEVQAVHQSYWYDISRTALKFDTSAFPNPAQVKLCVQRSGGAEQPQWIRAMRCSFTMWGETFEVYDTWAEIAGGAVMSLFEATGTPNLWASAIPPEHYAATADFDIGLIEETYDRPYIEPPDDTHQFELNGCVPYLEITYGGAAGGAMALLGVGT
jgi:hypothetical protein